MDRSRLAPAELTRVAAFARNHGFAAFVDKSDVVVLLAIKQPSELGSSHTHFHPYRISTLAEAITILTE